jgi:hypothetical protein
MNLGCIMTKDAFQNEHTRTHTLEA